MEVVAQDAGKFGHGVKEHHTKVSLRVGEFAAEVAEQFGEVGSYCGRHHGGAFRGGPGTVTGMRVGGWAGCGPALSVGIVGRSCEVVWCSGEGPGVGGVGDGVGDGVGEGVGEGGAAFGRGAQIRCWPSSVVVSMRRCRGIRSPGVAGCV
ncbi:hypothetical protein [Nonomuraea sp. NPDC050202]|uniref:hypothetical protein n=1 Tax=Nonomuraea sp. NPDC050202 TaxID=3155035 RepID=UPI00340A8896